MEKKERDAKRKSKVGNVAFLLSIGEADRSLIELKTFKNDYIIVEKKSTKEKKIRRVETDS